MQDVNGTDSATIGLGWWGHCKVHITLNCFTLKPHLWNVSCKTAAALIRVSIIPGEAAIEFDCWRQLALLLGAVLVLRMQTGAEIQCLCAYGAFVHRVLKHFCIHQFSGDENGAKFEQPTKLDHSWNKNPPKVPVTIKSLSPSWTWGTLNIFSKENRKWLWGLLRVLGLQTFSVIHMMQGYLEVDLTKASCGPDHSALKLAIQRSFIAAVPLEKDLIYRYTKNELIKITNTSFELKLLRWRIRWCQIEYQL